jgi:hypothetical protein
VKRWLITMSGANYDDTVGETVGLVKSGIGVDEMLVYDDVWLSQHPSWSIHSWLHEHPKKRGLAWYFWKAVIIQDAMRRATDGDVVGFVDADTVPIGKLDPLYHIAAANGAMLFEVTGQSNRKWCKRDCFIAMGQDSQEYWDSQAAVARFAFFKKGDYKAEDFVQQWGCYMTNRYCNTFDHSVLAPELKGYVEHRCDQAVEGLLAHKYGYHLFREACQNGNSNDANWNLYPQLFVQVPTTKHLNVTAPIEGSKYRNVL